MLITDQMIITLGKFSTHGCVLIIHSFHLLFLENSGLVVIPVTSACGVFFFLGVKLTLSALIDGKNFNAGGHKVGLGFELEA